MKQDKNIRREFLRNSTLAATGLVMAPGFYMAEKIKPVPVKLNRKPKVAFITTTYSTGSSHADVIGTKLFLGIPTDDGLVQPEVEIVSMWIDQILPPNPRPRGASIGTWPPEGYEEEYDFIIQDRFRQ